MRTINFLVAVCTMLAGCRGPTSMPGVVIPAPTMWLGNAVNRPIADPRGIVRCGSAYYITDSSAGLIRRYDPATGEYAILASGLKGPNSLQCAGTDGSLYVTQTFNSSIDLVDPQGGRVALQTLPTNTWPRGLAHDATSLIWANWGNSSSEGSSIYTWSPGTTRRLLYKDTGLGGEWGVTVAPDNETLFSVQNTQRIMKLRASDGEAMIVAGDGWQGECVTGDQLENCRFNEPLDIAIHGNDLYIMDANGIRRAINYLAYEGQAEVETVYETSSLGKPTTFLVDGGNLYVGVAGAVYRYGAEPVPPSTPTATPVPPTATKTRTSIPTHTPTLPHTPIPTATAPPTPTPTSGGGTLPQCSVVVPPSGCVTVNGTWGRD